MMKKKKRLKISLARITIGFYPFIDGAEIDTIELSKNVNHYIKKQIIVCPVPPVNYEYRDYSSFDLNFRVPIIRVKCLWWLSNLHLIGRTLMFSIFIFTCLLKLRKNLKEINIFYIHGSLLGSIFSIYSKLFRINKPIIIYEPSGNPFKISKSRTLSTFLSLNILRFFKIYSLVIVDDGMGVSEFSKICKNYNVKCITTYHGIDINKFTYREKENKNNFIILSNHRLVNSKRVDLGILAFKQFILKNKNENIKMIIIGDGKERKNLENLVKENKIDKLVEFHGFKKEEAVIKYINNSDIVIGTSIKSNYNRSVQEAMSCGKTVIVFDCGDIRRLIHHMYNGVLIENKNVEEFSNALNLLYHDDNLRSIISKNARNTIKKTRSWKIRINHELHLLNGAYNSKKN